MVFMVFKSDGYVRPTFILPHDLLYNIEAFIKRL